MVSPLLRTTIRSLAECFANWFQTSRSSSSARVGADQEQEAWEPGRVLVAIRTPGRGVEPRVSRMAVGAENRHEDS